MPGEKVGEAFVEIRPDTSGFAGILKAALTRPAQTAGADAGKQIAAGLLSGVGGTGKKLIEALGLAALGTFAIKSATDVEEANNLIVRSTGATGKALAGLQDSFKNVASTSAASFDAISSTLAELNQRTGLTGKALESLTSEVVTFNRTTKDAPITVSALTSALAGFNVPGRQMGEVLDHLFVISQKTGVPLAELLSTLQTAGPIARQFGFSVEFTAGFLAQLNKAGVDANLVLPGLRKAFVAFAQAGKEPAQGLRETIGSIQAFIKAGDIASARNIAVQLFGPRGVGLVDAAIAGKVSLDSLSRTIDTSGDGILATAKKTQTLGGALGILRNNAKLALAEFATPALTAANDVLRALLPTIQNLGKEFAALPGFVKVGTAGVIGLVAALGPIGQFAQGLGPLRNVFKAIQTGAILGSVRVLELVDSFRALTLAEAAAAAAPFALLAGIAAIAVGANQLGIGVDKAFNKMLADLKANEAAGKSLGSVLVASAKASTNELARLRSEQASLIAQAKALKGSDEERRPEIVRLGTAYNAVGAEIRNVVQAQREQKAAQAETSASLVVYNAQLAAGASETDAFASLTDDARKAVEAFAAAVLIASGGDIGYQQSLQAVQKAQQDYNDAVAEFGPTSSEALDAQLALRGAELQTAASSKTLKDENDKLIASLRSGEVSYAAQHAALEQQKIDFPQAAAGIQIEIDKLDAAKRAADALPTNIPIHVTADVSAAIANISGLQSLLGPGGFNFGILPHARGGIFDKAHVGVVAEKGREAILPLEDPRRSWSIIKESGLLDGPTGGPTTSSTTPPGGDTIIFNVTAPVRDPLSLAMQASKKLRLARWAVST